MLLQSRELVESLKDQKTWGLYLKGDLKYVFIKPKLKLRDRCIKLANIYIVGVHVYYMKQPL